MKLSALAKEQEILAKRVKRYDDPPCCSSIVIGLDVAYSKNLAAGAAIAIDSITKKTIISVTTIKECETEYIPSFFQLREGPILVELVQKLKISGVILVDGNGILHPRRFGLASFLGVKMDVQTIGVAKKLLLGTLVSQGENCADIVQDDEIIGKALWFNKKRTIYVSIGHRVSLETAVKVVTDSCVDGYPEALRRAHVLSKEVLSTEIG